MKVNEITKMLKDFEMIIGLNGDVGIPPKQYNSLAYEIQKILKKNKKSV